MSLIYIGQQCTIYGGPCLLVAGIVGNTLNILIFSSVRTYRTTPCSFYFLVGSIDNLFYILLNLTIRILSVGYGIDSTRASSAWCKIRQYLLVIPSIMSVTCSCLATIDQFLVTSRSAYLRRCSTIKWAHRLVIIFIIVWCLHGIPILLFYDISTISKTCVNTNDAFAIYIPIYLLGLITFLPVTIMAVFGWLTYRNIQQTRVLAEQNADRQLTRMTLIQVGLVVISLVPYGFYNIYSTITSTATKSTDQKSKEYLASSILSMMTYFFYVGGCYMFLATSSRFRQAVKDRLFWWQRQNRVIPY